MAFFTFLLYSPMCFRSTICFVNLVNLVYLFQHFSLVFLRLSFIIFGTCFSLYTSYPRFCTIFPMFSYNYLVLFVLRYIYILIFVQRIFSAIHQNHFWKKFHFSFKSAFSIIHPHSRIINSYTRYKKLFIIDFCFETNHGLSWVFFV